jgi:uncharacterized protein with GYD domain
LLAISENIDRLISNDLVGTSNRWEIILASAGPLSIMSGGPKVKNQVGGIMIRLVTRGRFTQDYAKGLVAAPEDREPAVRKLVEGAGGRLVSFYFTTGDSDFMVISEADEAESLIAGFLAVAAAGTISNVTTARAWTGAEFKAVAEKASKAASHYRSPGKG